MHFSIIKRYDNYVEAHISKGVLEENDIECWLKDENTVTLDPLLTNAIGGIKLMVNTDKVEAAKEILNKLRAEQKEKVVCGKCGSHNIELVSTPRKPVNWLMAFFVSTPNAGFEKVNHCFDCGNEFPYEYTDE
ncbi:MAG: hypothetical protein RIR12_1002 [Bacteroidota bacterium]|jgi:hypothetical protein